MTTWLRLTRGISRRPASGSFHWWMVMVAITASKLSSSKGRSSAVALIAGTRSGERCARIIAEGSIAATYRSSGS